MESLQPAIMNPELVSPVFFMVMLLFAGIHFIMVMLFFVGIHFIVVMLNCLLPFSGFVRMHITGRFINIPSALPYMPATHPYCSGERRRRWRRNNYCGHRRHWESNVNEYMRLCRTRTGQQSNEYKGHEDFVTSFHVSKY